jgi:hypothetical protein
MSSIAFFTARKQLPEGSGDPANVMTVGLLPFRDQYSAGVHHQTDDMARCKSHQLLFCLFPLKNWEHIHNFCIKHPPVHIFLIAAAMHYFTPQEYHIN